MRRRGVAAIGLASWGLGRWFAVCDLRYRQRDRVLAEQEILAVVSERDRFTAEQAIRRGVMADGDEDLAVVDHHTKRQAVQFAGEPWREGELAAVITHAAESGDTVDPRAGQGRDMQSAADIVMQIVQVGENVSTR